MGSNCWEITTKGSRRSSSPGSQMGPHLTSSPFYLQLVPPLAYTTQKPEGKRSPLDVAQRGQPPRHRTLRRVEKCSGGTRRITSTDNSFIKLMQFFPGSSQKNPGPLMNVCMMPVCFMQLSLNESTTKLLNPTGK